MKVLVIESSPVMCDRLLMLLEESGTYEGLGCVSCSAVALELVEACLPDALLLDLHAAQGNGFAVLEALRDAGLDVPVVVLSDSDQPPYQARARALGAVAFLRKSQCNEIVPTLDRVFGICALQREFAL